MLLLSVLLAAAALLPAQDITEYKPEGPAFKVFQFPSNRIPRIDGEFSDWDIVPDSYAVGIDSMWDDSGKHEGIDRSTLDIKVKVGWVKGLNRLYFLYEAYDNYWDFNTLGLRNDTFEIVVDADLSGGPHIAEMRPDMETRSEMQAFFDFQNAHAQNYHIMTPPAEGKSWTMVWGPQEWLKYLPYANFAYSYNFKHGESGKLKLEFYITPFDWASSEGPEKSIVSELNEGKQIGLCWAVIDYDGEPGPANSGFWNLSKHHKMYGNASMERLFELQPLEPCFTKKIEAAWSHKVLPGTRIVKFKDESKGRISSWHWDFGDGTSSDEQNPVHVYQQDGAHNVVTLYVSGPDGESRLCKVWDVCVLGSADTESSLFWRRDSIQTKEIISEEAVQYKKVGHHGPAVENAGSAFRIYFNDSGAIDVYSKAGSGMELRKYLWYPTASQQAEEGAGCDEYLVGKTVGIGGIALWDGKMEVKLAATEGRTARVGDTPNGSFAEMISYGVKCGGKSYDISVRIDVEKGSRVAKVTATELNGRKVRFLTGVNHHPGESVQTSDSWASVWGVHPSDVSVHPIPLGAGIIFDKKTFPSVTRTENMVRLISKPTSKVSTGLVSASTKENELNDETSFVSLVRSLSELSGVIINGPALP